MRKSNQIIYIATTFGGKKLIASKRYYKVKRVLYQSDVGGIFWRIEDGVAEKVRTFRWNKSKI